MEQSIIGKPAPPVEGSGGFKRKRSTSIETPNATNAIPPPAKTVKTGGTATAVNYLTRTYNDTLSLIDQRDSLRTILDLLNDYVSIMERHESLASNLGAKPLGPMLMKRFERLFDDRPRILKSNSKDNVPVTWLDVVDFARLKPEQFNLEKQRDGVKVCQFYTKQCRVEISEEDFLLISSGMPQKLIPPQPIPEDEEKELATIEILEKSVAVVSSLAEQVQTKIRSFRTRLATRKNAVANRRQQESPLELIAPTEPETPGSPASGFVAVNRNTGTNGTTNGKPPAIVAASPTVRAELEVLFANIRDGIVEGSPPASTRPHVHTTAKPKIKIDPNDPNSTTGNSVAIPNTPQGLVNHQKPSQVDKNDDSGPYKAEMLSRMEALNRGDRVMPPCDRCRRLHMDCLKNLTACQGCTRKHAKCSWKEVTEQELIDNPRPIKEIGLPPPPTPAIPEGPPQPVRDEELLGEDDSDDESAPVLPKIEPAGDTPGPYKESSLPPLSSSRIESSPMRETVQQSQEEIVARAKDILSNRMVEITASNPVPGLAGINQNQAPIAEMRMYEPPVDLEYIPMKQEQSSTIQHGLPSPLQTVDGTTQNLPPVPSHATLPSQNHWTG